MGYSPGYHPISEPVAIQGFGDSPAAQFFWWVHFFLSSTEIPRIAELSGNLSVRRAINLRRPGAQRLRRILVRRTARRAGISYLLERYRDIRDEDGSLIVSSFVQQPPRLQLPLKKIGTPWQHGAIRDLNNMYEQASKVWRRERGLSVGNLRTEVPGTTTIRVPIPRIQNITT